jgi:hypothetical protein
LREEKQRREKNFSNILPLQSRSPERGPPFPSHVYYSSSSQRSFPLSKFERVFEAIRKNNNDCKEILKNTTTKRGILRSKYHRKQQRNQFPKTRSSEQ